MSDVETNSTKETSSSEEVNKEVSTDLDAKQTASEESGSTSGNEKSEQVDNFSQMYDMLTERDKTIEKLSKEISELKKSNTELLLKVNSSATGSVTSDPFKAFVDEMSKR